MNIRTIATLAVAIVLGLIAVLLVRSFLAAPKNAHPTGVAGPSTPVVVAAIPIDRGATLDPKLLKVANYPSDSVPAGSFRTVAELTGAGPNARLALRSITADEPLLAPEVTGPGGKLTLSSSMTEGMRAVSVRSNEVVGVAGFVLPGDRVDILLTRQVGSGDTAQTVTQVLAQNVRVLGVDQSDNDEANKPVITRAVTVEVTPNQAQTISLAQAVGTVSFALRQVADASPLGRSVTTVADLGFAPRAKPVKPASTRPRVGPNEKEIKVTRGVDSFGYVVSRY